MKLKWDFDEVDENEEKKQTNELNKIADKASLRSINVNWISWIFLLNAAFCIDWSNPVNEVPIHSTDWIYLIQKKHEEYFFCWSGFYFALG